MAYNVPPLNPYDPNSQNQQPETPSHDQVLMMAIQAAMTKAKFCLPGKIVTVHGNQKVDVQLVLQSRYAADNTVITIPPLQNVSVNMPFGQGWRIKLPIKVGDTGWCIFCDRSLDIWMSGDGGIVDPQDTRTHDISDPIFIPGAVPFSQQSEDPADQMILVNGDAQIVLEPDGTFQIKNQAQELLNNLVNLVQTLSTASTVVGGPFTPDVVTTLTEITQNLTTLMGT